MLVKMSKLKAKLLLFISFFFIPTCNTRTCLARKCEDHRCPKGFSEDEETWPCLVRDPNYPDDPNHTVEGWCAQVETPEGGKHPQYDSSTYMSVWRPSRGTSHVPNAVETSSYKQRCGFSMQFSFQHFFSFYGCYMFLLNCFTRFKFILLDFAIDSAIFTMWLQTQLS